jgi:hypothetical protein
MPSLRITRFGGINTEVAARLSGPSVAQTAHNCLLWDGTLRPLAQWQKIQGVDYLAARAITLSSDNKIVVPSPLLDTVFATGLNYPANSKIGLSFLPPNGVDPNIVYTSDVVAGYVPVGLHRPVLSGSINYSREYRSDKPMNRLYAVSGVRHIGNYVQESVLTLIPNQSAQSILYEGDIANVSVTATTVGAPYDALRLYRTISGMDIGSSPQNDFDTEWHLIAELAGGASLSYADGGAGTNDPLDLFLGKAFYPPYNIEYAHLQYLNSGWLAAASTDGYIAISERYLYHAWPIENLVHIPGEVLTDCKAQFDNLFIGTENRPYIVTVGTGEKLGAQINVTPYAENYKCLKNTMGTTASGAMYASPSGIVSLTRDGMKLISAGVSSGVRPIYSIPRIISYMEDGVTKTKQLYYPMRFEHTSYAAYHHGTYFGFCKVPVNELDEENNPKYLFKGYAFETGSSLDGEHEIGKFTTYDTPFGIRSHAIGGSGMYVLGIEGVFRMPFPDSQGTEEYNKAEKLCYNWKSRKYVFPGDMVMAAAKVDHDCKGHVRLKIYVDCCCVYETKVHDCKPFTLPPNLVGVTWEVELIGTSAVHEVHLASSLRELQEHE